MGKLGNMQMDLRPGSEPGEGVFDQVNYSSNALAFDALTEQQHIDVFFAVGFTALPELSSALLFGLAGLEFLCRSR